MIVGLAFGTGVLIAWALGARLSALADVRLRGDGLVFLSLGLQVAIFTPIARGALAGWVPALHLTSYALLAVFFLLNIRMPGFWLVGAGVAANLLVIAANHGRMPISAANWMLIGGDRVTLAHGGGDNNVISGPGTHLAWLGDVFVLPHALPFTAAISLGDIIVVLGAVGFVYRACAPALAGASTSLRAPLSSAAFRRVIAGRLVSGTGDWLSQVAVLTWIYLETRSTLLVSIYLVGRIIAAVAGGIASAPLLDRVGGFRALGTVEALRGLLTAAMIPFGLANWVLAVIALSTLSALLSAATTPSAAGLLPDIVAEDELHAANALHNLAPSVTSIIGAGLGAALVIHWGLAVALTVDVATFVMAALMYRRFAAGAASEPRRIGPTPSRRVLLRAVTRNPVLVGVASSFACSTAAFGLLNATTSVLFDRRFHSPQAYGYVAAMIGVGYLVGEALTARIRRPTVVRRSISVALLITSGATFLIADAPTLATAFLGMFVLGAADGVTEVGHDTLIQRHTPRAILGGTFAVIGSVERAGMIAGLVAAPFIVGSHPPETAVRIAGALMLIGAALAGACLIGESETDRSADTQPAGAAMPSSDPKTSTPHVESPVPILMQRPPAAFTNVATEGDPIDGASIDVRPG